MGLIVVKYFGWNRDGKNVPDVKPQVVQKRVTSMEKRHSWGALLKPKKNTEPKIPSIGAILKATDDAIFSPSLLSQASPEPTEPSWRLLYDSFATALASRPIPERASYPSHVSELVRDMRRRGKHENPNMAFQQRSASLSTRRTSLNLSRRGTKGSKSRLSGKEMDLVRCSEPLPSSEAVTRKGNESAGWMSEVTAIRKSEGKEFLSATREELTALALVLGVKLESVPLTENAAAAGSSLPVIRGTGAFGISIIGEPSDESTAHYNFRFQYEESPLTHRLPKGSSYSSLFAKHLPYGSLPYSQDSQTISAIYIDADATKALQSGTALTLAPLETPTTQLTELSSLPSSKSTTTFTLVPHAFTPEPRPPQLPTELLTAISTLPFSGGLSPLASPSLAKTITFIASGGSPPGRLLQRLEDLIHKVHRQAPHLHLFGPLLSDSNLRSWTKEREKLGGEISEEPGSRVARVGRYTTLIERLIALVPSTSPNDVLAAVREATRREMDAAYAAALGHPPTPSSPIPTPRDAPIALPKRARSTAVPRLSSHSRAFSWSPSVLTSPISSPRASLSLNRHSLSGQRRSAEESSLERKAMGAEALVNSGLDLGRQVERILKMGLPLGVGEVAVVVRLVIVGWSLGVGVGEGVGLPGRLYLG